MLKWFEVAFVAMAAILVATGASACVYFSFWPIADEWTQWHPTWSDAMDCEDPHQFPLYRTDLPIVTNDAL